MRDFSKRGSAIAGLVGVLSFVVLIAVGGFALYGNSSPPLGSQAAVEILDVNLGLVVETFPLSVSWTGPKNPDENAKYMVTVKNSDGTAIPGVREKLLAEKTHTADFSTLNLPSGSYYVQLRYVPSTGPVLRQIKNFEI